MIEIDAKLELKPLNRFLMYHNYMRPGGIAGVIISVAAIVCLFVGWSNWTYTQKGLLVVLALLFTVIQPLMLIARGKKQLSMEQFQKSFHYTFDPDKVSVSQDGEKQEFGWDEIRKVVIRKDAIYVYMTTQSAFVLAKDQCGADYDRLLQLVKENYKK